MDEPFNRRRRRNGQAMSIAAQIIQQASLHNTAVCAENIYNIVINSPRASNLGEFTFSSRNGWRRFLAIGYQRSLWDRVKLTVPGHTGSSSVFFYFFSHFVDLETIKYGTAPDIWVRNINGDYVIETDETEILINVSTGRSAQKMDTASWEKKYGKKDPRKQ